MVNATRWETIASRWRDSVRCAPRFLPYMRLIIIGTLVVCAVPVFFLCPARAQTDDPLSEAKRLNEKCVELVEAGKYDDAMEPCQRALAIREKALGNEHPE